MKFKPKFSLRNLYNIPLHIGQCLKKQQETETSVYWDCAQPKWGYTGNKAMLKCNKRRNDISFWLKHCNEESVVLFTAGIW